MKGVLSIMIAAILFSGIAVSPALGQSLQVTVDTDKQQYSPGDAVNVSGMISKIITGTPVTVQLKASNGNLVSVAQVLPNDDGTWSTEIKLSPATKAGTYSLSILYGKWENSTTFTVGQSTAQIGEERQTAELGSAQTALGSTSYELDEMDISYDIVGGTIVAIYPDTESNSLIIEIEAADDGVLTISLPREVIDSDGTGPLNGEFFVLVDGEENNFEETAASTTHRTLKIEFNAGSEIIEIIGTKVIPEFGVVAIVILAIAVMSIVAITSRSRLSSVTGL